MMLFTGTQLCHAYDQALRDTLVLDHLDFGIAKGEVVALSGPSGSGKSTLLSILGLMEKPLQGSLRFQGTDIPSASERDLNRLRRFEIGYIFQDFHLIEVLNVEENVAYFLHRQGLRSAEREKRVDDALSAVGLLDLRRHLVNQLSGGQRQRVAIARALAKKPAVILADEPTASLDQANGIQVMTALKGLNNDLGMTVVVASHDPIVLQYATRVMRLRDGRLENPRDLDDHRTKREEALRVG